MLPADWRILFLNSEEDGKFDISRLQCYVSPSWLNDKPFPGELHVDDLLFSAIGQKLTRNEQLNCVTLDAVYTFSLV